MSVSCLNPACLNTMPDLCTVWRNRLQCQTDIPSRTSMRTNPSEHAAVTALIAAIRAATTSSSTSAAGTACVLACLTVHIIDIWASLNFYYNTSVLKLLSMPFWVLYSRYRYFYGRAIVFTHSRRPSRYHCCCQAVCHLLRAV